MLGLRRLRLACALAALMVAAFTLASCGRNGPPLPPPGPVAAQPPSAAVAGALPPGAPGAPVGGPAGDAQAQANAQKNGFDLLGNPVAPSGQKKSFLLDPLLQ